MARRLVLEDSAVDSLLYNNLVTEKFPFLKDAAVQRKHAASGHSSCCGRSVATDYNVIKSSIAAMSSQDAALLKSLINYDEIQVVYMVGNKTIEKFI